MFKVEDHIVLVRQAHLSTGHVTMTVYLRHMVVKGSKMTTKHSLSHISQDDKTRQSCSTVPVDI